MALKEKTGVDTYMINRPMFGQTVSGDVGIIEALDGKLFIGLIDVAGHGKEAHELAISCKEFIQGRFGKMDLSKLMGELHQHIRRSRGAAVSLCELAPTTGELEYVGIGNIYARTFGASGCSLASRSGLVGQAIPRPLEVQRTLGDGECLVLCSDGVSTHFLNSLPLEFFEADLKTIATQLVSRYGKDSDDASCIVVRNGGGS